MRGPSPTLRDRVRAGERTFGTFLDLASPLSAEVAGRAGFDWLMIDLEHGSATETDLLPLLLAVQGTGAAALVRPQSGERLRIGRALDLGADGIMVPRLDTPDQVREAVSYLRYPPSGVRGVALRTRGAGLGSIAHGEIGGVNDRILGIIQIESRAAVEAVDEIAAIDGADVLFVGPTDLSHSLGVPGRFDDPTYQDALARVLAACGRHGKATGILLYDRAALERHLEVGFNFVGLGSEGSFVADGARAMLAAVGR
jgi:2-dehydro-3-deoxyglucarate aldolase/4-hydroxy-2-oxoheptanedioate aldolase